MKILSCHAVLDYAQVINELNTYLHQLYPQQVNANDAAQQLVQTIEKEDVDSWWWMGYFGGIVLRLYYVPTYKRTSPIGLVLHFVLRRERDSLAQFFARIVRDQLGRDKSPRSWV